MTTTSPVGLSRNAVLLGVIGLLATVSIANGQLTITDPAAPETSESEVKQNNWVTQQSHVQSDASEPVWTRSRQQSGSTTASQVHVQTVALLVDDETKKWIYEQISSPGMTIQTTSPPPVELTDLTTFSKAVETRASVRSPTRGGRCVIANSLATTLIQYVDGLTGCEVKRSPAMTLIEGRQAEMNEVVEHPFVIGENEIDSKPIIETFEQGTRIRMLAYRRARAITLATDEDAAPSIQLVAQIISSKLSEADHEYPLKSSDEASFAAAPRQQIKSIVVSAGLLEDQSLIVDPRVTRSVNIQQDQPTAILGKIPFIGKNFSHSESTLIQHHVLFLMMPKLIRSQRQAKQFYDKESNASTDQPMGFADR